MRERSEKASKTEGTRSKVVSKKLSPELVTDSRFITLTIFEIERSWAYAMQLSSEANSEPRKRFHVASRLRKATRRADELLELTAQLDCDAQTQLELQGYCHWIHGIRYFEAKDWLQAKKRLEASQKIYEGLLKTVDKDVRVVYESRISDLLPRLRYCAHNIGDTSAASDLLKMRNVEDGGKGGMSARGGKIGVGMLQQSELDQLLSQVIASQAQSVTEVQWLGQTIPVKLETARLAIMSAKEADAELKQLDNIPAKLLLYESVLKSCVEAIASVRDEMHTLAAAEAAATAAATTGDAAGKTVASKHHNQQEQVDISKLPRIKLLHTYLQYIKLCRTVSRNLLHVEAALMMGRSDTDTITTSAHPKPQELARLHDTIVQTLQEVTGLPGILQEREDIRDILQAKVLAYRSFRMATSCSICRSAPDGDDKAAKIPNNRLFLGIAQVMIISTCYHLALAYIRGKKFTEGSALLARAQMHARQAVDALTSAAAVDDEDVPGAGVTELVDQLAALDRQADAEQLTCRAGKMLEIVGGGDADGDGDAVDPAKEALSKEPLIEHLDKFVDERCMERKLLSSANPLVPFPPDFEPVAAKPVFFDLALNHITFPNLTDQLPGSMGDATGAGARVRSGLTGMVRGWLWGGGGAETTSSK